MHVSLVELEKNLWSVADELRANPELKLSEYLGSVLGLIFLRYADVKFAQAHEELKAGEPGVSRSGQLTTRPRM